MIQSVGERDFSAQETAHLLLSLPLYSCTYSFVTINLDGGRQIRDNLSDFQEDEPALNLSLLDFYAHRLQHETTFPNIISMNLIQFASSYTIYRSNLTKRSNPVIVRTFPIYNPNPNSANYSLYCKYQLIKLKPWHTSPANAWENQPPSSDVFISSYREFLTTEFAQLHVTTLADDLERAQQYISQETIDDDYDEPHLMQQQEEWMILSQLQPTFQQEDHSMDNIDWSEASHELPHPLLLSCPNWIRSMKSQQNATTDSLNYQLPTLDTNDLTEQQQIAYQIVSNHYTSYSEGHMPDPLLMLILGTAGTGKSFLIGTLTNLLTNHCLITATTGMAAYHIHGMTLHSALQLPVRDHNCNDLQGSSLASLQQRLAGIHHN